VDERLQRNPLGYWEVVEKPTPETLQAFYAERYFQTEQGSYRHSYPPEELRYIDAKLQQWWEQVRAIRGGAAGYMLDIGCGEGFALAFFREMGWCCEGLDYSVDGIARQNPGCRDAVTAGDVVELLEERIRQGRRYDLLWLTNVLEHVVDPAGLLTALGKVLQNDGVLVVAVPNDFSKYQLALLEAGHIDRSFWVSLPAHLGYFDRESLQRIARASGWKCREILADFPIDWFLMHPGSNYVRDPANGKAAHQARILLENALSTLPAADVNRFYSAMAAVGMGRTLAAFLTRE